MKNLSKKYIFLIIFILILIALIIFLKIYINNKKSNDARTKFLNKVSSLVNNAREEYSKGIVSGNIINCFSNDLNTLSSVNNEYKYVIKILNNDNEIYLNWQIINDEFSSSNTTNSIKKISIDKEKLNQINISCN